eukprot:CAMPEP_0174762368 /NCGR_PEP_ID=MMETSP1094-20130205/109742_1 /TAXON_ID=156173 /ORGANISM="Chrysochromulina brevifilum, Strain UTEX LB 985" /LENGTH=312 /DNA_ID=CAMNT_0015968321 /DNA_START=622 /DNA_END=1560 /DNA_ORIENTATION=-
MAIILMLFSVVFTRELRSRFVLFLGRLSLSSNAQSELQQAAVISQLVAASGQSVENMCEEAMKNFRAIPYEKLREDDLSSNQDTGLANRAVLVPLGGCDAFMSHSWSDNAAIKWKELTRWITIFQTHTGRMPTLWIDKGCIDQSNITTSLGYLPIFLGGCQKLLVLCGETYPTRLWCILEIFVFLKVTNAAGDRIELASLMPDKMSVLDVICRLDASSARCYLESDRQRLLAVLESGFGDLDRFNKCAHKLLIGAKGRYSQIKKRLAKSGSSLKDLSLRSISKHRWKSSSRCTGATHGETSGHVVSELVVSV